MTWVGSTMEKDLILLIISGVGVVLWYFVITLINDLKQSNQEQCKLLIDIEKSLVEIRVKLSNTDQRIDRLERDNGKIWEAINEMRK